MAELGVSEYLVAILHKKTGEVVTGEPGGRLETDLEEALVARVAAKGVGVGRTTAHVCGDVRAALREVLHALKVQV